MKNKFQYCVSVSGHDQEWSLDTLWLFVGVEKIRFERKQPIRRSLPDILSAIHTADATSLSS